MKKLKVIITKDELMEIIREIVNAQDKFIVMALFNGISGEDMVEIRELKVSDVDFENNTITLPNRKIKMDAQFMEITKEAIAQRTYLNKSSDSIYATEKFDFNMDSEYILKSKPNSKNNFGNREMAYQALRTRVKRLGLPVNPKDLIDSGMIHRLLKIQPVYTVAEVETTLKKLGYKMSAYRVYSLLNEINDSKYFSKG